MMKTTYRLLIILIIGVIIWKAFHHYLVLPSEQLKQTLDNVQSLPDKGKITISVYYEALCSDSRSFIIKQLVPAYESIPGFILLDLIPYGKAKTIEKNGKIEFECQHAALECLANKIHACAIKYIPSPGLQLKYIACMINDNMIPRSAGEKCAEELGVNFAPISKCTDDEESALLLKEYGERTQNLHPPATFIPTVELNHSQKVPLTLILKNLLKELCNLLTVKPNVCL